MSLLALYQDLFRTEDDAELDRRSRRLIDSIASSSDDSLREFLATASVVGSSSRGLWSAYVAIRFARALCPADEFMLDGDFDSPDEISHIDLNT